MGKFNEYSQKATPADNDTMMIYDARSTLWNAHIITSIQHSNINSWRWNYVCKRLHW